MQQLDAVQVGQVGYGDVQAAEGHETALKPWIDQLFGICGLEIKLSTLPPKVILSKCVKEDKEYIHKTFTRL